MNIELTKVRIADLFKGYKDSQEEGVVAYSGLLDVRPKYQREFVYKDKQRDGSIFPRKGCSGYGQTSEAV